MVSWLLQKRNELAIKNPVLLRWGKGSFWSLLGAFFANVLGLAASFLIARVLGKVAFGEYGIIINTINLFQSLADFGLGGTTTKYVAELRTTDPQRAGRIIGLSILVSMVTGIVTAFILFLSSPFIADRFLASPPLSPYLQLSALILIIFALSSTLTGALSGFELFREIAVINSVNGIARSVFMSLGAYMWGIWGVLYGVTIAFLLSLLMSSFFLRQQLKQHQIQLDFRAARRESSVLLKFSLPVLLTGFLGPPAIWICNTIIVNQPNGYGEMGIFNATNQWRMAILFFPSALGNVLLPLLSNLYGNRNQKEFTRTVALNLGLNGVIVVSLALLITLFSNLIMTSYGAGFSSGQNTLVIIAWATVCAALANVMGYSILSRGKTWPAFVINLLWAAALILLTLLFKERGAEGLALAYLLSYLFHLFNVSLYFYHLNKQTMQPEVLL